MAFTETPRNTPEDAQARALEEFIAYLTEDNEREENLWRNRDGLESGTAREEKPSTEDIDVVRYDERTLNIIEKTVKVTHQTLDDILSGDHILESAGELVQLINAVMVVKDYE